jgi:hypothetical protein
MEAMMAMTGIIRIRITFLVVIHLSFPLYSRAKKSIAGAISREGIYMAMEKNNRNGYQIVIIESPYNAVHPAPINIIYIKGREAGVSGYFCTYNAITMQSAVAMIKGHI